MFKREQDVPPSTILPHQHETLRFCVTEVCNNLGVLEGILAVFTSSRKFKYYHVNLGKVVNYISEIDIGTMARRLVKRHPW